MIIDCHTHWGIGWDARDGEDPAQWLSCLDAHGVSRAFLLGHAGLTQSGLCGPDNDKLLRLASLVPDRLIPFPTAWPQGGKHALQEVRRVLDHPLCGGLKFHPWLQGFSTADAVFGEICGIAGEAGAPVLLHDGTPCYSLPEQVAGLARRFPRTTFILGHSGLLWAWRSALEAALEPNVWLCLCGPHLRAIETICARADGSRIVWGSDYGFGFADQIEYRLNLFLRARIDDRLKERILSDNAARLPRRR
jgi:uncharacterized protein